MATSKIEDSSDFFISYNEDGQSAYEFSIGHMPSSSLEEREVKPISRYLYAPVNVRGKNRGPLTLRLDARDKHTKMTLHSRRIRNFAPVDTKDWLSSRDIFYISCKQRFIGRNSYICVKRKSQSSETAEEHHTYCVPTISKHNESNEHYMLFRLHRATKRKLPEKKEKPKEEPLGIRRNTLFKKDPSKIPQFDSALAATADKMVDAHKVRRENEGHETRRFSSIVVEVETETAM